MLSLATKKRPARSYLVMSENDSERACWDMQDVDIDSGWIGCGVYWGMLSSGPASHSGTAGYSEPSCMRLLSAGGGGVGCTGRRRLTRSRGVAVWWDAGERREAGVGPEGDTRRVLVRAGWIGSSGWRKEALTAMLACDAGRIYAAHRCLSFRQVGGG